MTVSEMADYVCEVYGKTDDSTKATVKKFIRHRYRMICDSALWKDMLGVCTAPVNSRGVILPEDVDRVIHVVFNGDSMAVGDLIHDAIVNPQQISTVDSSTFASADSSGSGSEVSIEDMEVQVASGVLRLQDPDTGLWYDIRIRSIGGAPSISVEGAGS